MRARASRSARAIAIRRPGARRTTSFSCPAASSSFWRWPIPAPLSRTRERHFSFGAFNRDFLARGQGLSMLVLEGQDSAAEAQAFRAAGIGDFDLFDFARDARRPDGTPTKVAFTLAFARDAAAPDIGFFTCRQHYPENFWNPAFQNHANGVTGIAGIVLVADRPQDHRAFLAAFTGADVARDHVRHHRQKLRAAKSSDASPASFARRFGAMPPPTRTAAPGLRPCVSRSETWPTARAALQSWKSRLFRAGTAPCDRTRSCLRRNARVRRRALTSTGAARMVAREDDR